MPAFIRTPKDEARWERAKKAASKTRSEAEGDTYWALVNHIYHRMKKSDDDDAHDLLEMLSNATSLDDVKFALEKARRRILDEPEEEDEPEEREPGEDEPEISEERGFREFDPDEEAESERWLQEHDPERNSKHEEPIGEDYGYDEYRPEEDEKAHQRAAEVGEKPSAPTAVPLEAASIKAREGVKDEEIPQEIRTPSRFPQPTREDIAEMRQYTRPWEQRARETTRLSAEAHKNPVLHHEGQLIEARNTAHRDRQNALTAFQVLPEYQGADPITQMEMDAKFDKDWNEKNPDHIRNAMNLHTEAHIKGQRAKNIHAAVKDEQIRHILAGGTALDDPITTEAALQHVGGAKEEEGTVGSIIQDRAAAFAAGNKEFLTQYGKDYAKKMKKPTELSDMMQYDDESRADMHRVLGKHPALKDPVKKAKVDSFFEKYHPLIAISAHKVLNKLNLDKRRGDIDMGMLHEAGMHGMFQAINDYDHDHPSQASFATHAGNKMRGLMQTALRVQDDIPQELKTKAKRFAQVEVPVSVQQPEKVGPIKVPVVSPVAAAQPPERSSMTIIKKHPSAVISRYNRIQPSRQVKISKPEEGER